MADSYTPHPSRQAPDSQPAPKRRWWSLTPQTANVLVTSAATALAVGVNLSVMRRASRLLSAGKPLGAFLGKLVPGLMVALGGYSVYKRLANEWSAAGNVRKWDDIARIAGDSLTMLGGAMAFVPAIGLVPGLATATVGSLLVWLGEVSNDVGLGATSPELTPKGRALAEQQGLEATVPNVKAYLGEIRGYGTDGSLGPGSESKAVLHLQDQLARQGFSLAATGDYDEQTILAVTTFKINHDLHQSYKDKNGLWVINEIADRQTRAALN